MVIGCSRLLLAMPRVIGRNCADFLNAEAFPSKDKTPLELMLNSLFWLPLRIEYLSFSPVNS